MNFNAIAQEYLPALRARTDTPERVDTLLTRLNLGVREGRFALAQVAEILAGVLQVADPADTLLYLLQFSEEEGGARRLAAPGALGVFIILAGQGEHPAHLLQRHPDDLLYLAEGHLNQQRNYVGRGLESLLDELNARIDAGVADGRALEEVAFAELRRLKRRESLRIYLREVENASSVRQTAAEIANLAQACLEVACVQGARLLGRPELVEHFCVLGMGKLGGTELNFSSDVDLIYICSNWICTDPAALDEGLKSKIDQLGRWVTRAMSEATDEGYVFRVDLRLRPDGNKGGLVNSVGAMVNYYLNWGSTWERSALIKARAVGGNHALADALFEELEPFMFRRYLDFKVIDELRSMKEKIDRNAHVSAIVGLKEQEVLPQLEPTRPVSALQSRMRKKLGRTGALRRSRAGKVLAKEVRPEPSAGSNGGNSGAKAPTPSEPAEADQRRDARDASPFGWDVKIGVGGIREIEFFVQALQLIHCGTRESLRVRGTLEALDRLLYVGLITHEDHRCLADAYDLFRRVEHRIQMESDRQSHRLPADVDGFQRLAQRMLMDEDALRSALTYSREKVAVIFERLFRDSAKTSREPTVRESRPSELVTVMGVSPERLFDPVVLDSLVALGFRRPRQVAGQVQVLREQNYGPFGLRAGTEQSQLGRYLLQACASAPDPDQALSNWARLSAIIGDRPSFYGMLFENPHATRLLVHVLGSSEFLASIILREPNIIDYLLGSSTVAVVRERDEMADELARRLSGIKDPSHRLGRVRRFHQEEVLRIALHEVAGACEIEVSVRQLSMLAEVLIDAVLGEVYANLCEGLEGDRPVPPLEELGFVVLAMGKLGGREISIGSDLDIVFIYEPDDTLGFDPSFYMRLAQRLVRNLSSVSAQGKMYEVDTRLRPSGSQGTLVVSLDAFREYHAMHADLWERQAMVRARALTGPPGLRRRLMALRQKIAFESENPADLARAMFEMRRRISREFGSAGTSFDIKFDAGGMVDVEFLTQYLQLYYGRRVSNIDGAEAGRAEVDSVAQRLGEGVVFGPRSQNTMHALAGFAEAVEREEISLGIDCLQLLEDYRMLRRVEARLRMSDLRASNQLPTEVEELNILARRLGFQGGSAGEQLRTELDVLAERVSLALEAVLGQSP
ncbi:hypothetical protein [Bradymonas sediminis]|uniref:Uncharacterized protein n=1 Tax=Bradymonas sediminis TaxID=1548548 RepID=A0A2Z4FMM6_9DELT|nr:hypothetical protein [Bradymonas sediminis]AWV89944.1 hypothetical protein DN745_11575 [Bradymonas sediminis]TDP62165.1 GlnD PII-uridylyltransferase [Bradymonas sediminis]